MDWIMSNWIMTNEQWIFLKYFTITYVLNYLYVMFNKKSFNEKFLLMGNI